MWIFLSVMTSWGVALNSFYERTYIHFTGQLFCISSLKMGNIPSLSDGFNLVEFVAPIFWSMYKVQ
jgi:hypothetical protein